MNREQAAQKLALCAFGHTGAERFCLVCAAVKGGWVGSHAASESPSGVACEQCAEAHALFYHGIGRRRRRLFSTRKPVGQVDSIDGTVGIMVR